MTTTPRTKRNSLPGLWEQAVILWNDLVLGFGHPEDLMRWGWMRALEHRALGHWLRDLEKLVRRAIRADAAELDLPAPGPRAKRQPPRPPQSNDDMPRFRRSYGDDCTTWKVSFRMSVAVARKHRGPRKRSEPPERRRCRNLAYRIEALRRAVNYRKDYVLRYARRLARLAAARRRAYEESAAPHLHDRPEHDAHSPMTSPAQFSAKHVEPG